MQNCSTGNKDEPSPSSLCDAASPERGGFALLTARWQNGESGEQSEMTGGVFHVLRPLRLLPLVAATSPKGRGKSSAGSFLIALNTLATRAAACALSVKACRLCQLSQRESQVHSQTVSRFSSSFSNELHGLAPPLRKDFPRSGGRCHRR